MTRFLTRARATLAVAMLAAGALAAGAATPDAWITTKAKMALLTTEGVHGTDVHVDTVNGLVTLYGKVGTDAERKKAEATVRGIDGVATVRNLLQVVSRPEESTVNASDDQVETRVQDALRRDPALRDVTVQSVDKGVVLLAGHVDTMGDHLRAVERTAAVPGVQRVASEIRIPDTLADSEIYADRPDATASANRGGVSDLWITSAVKMRLLADERTPGLDVNVDTTNGAVTLFGMVPTTEAKRAAEEDAKKVSGVKAVSNQLQVVPKPQERAVRESDDRIKASVEQALRAQDELRDDHIDVEVRDGVARLTGTVESATDRLRAAAVARTAPGVRAVSEDLRVATSR